MTYSLQPRTRSKTQVSANPTLLFPWLCDESCSNEDLSLYFGGMSQGFDLNYEMHSCLSAHVQSSKSSH